MIRDAKVVGSNLWKLREWHENPCKLSMCENKTTRKESLMLQLHFCKYHMDDFKNGPLLAILNITNRSIFFKKNWFQFNHTIKCIFNITMSHHNFSKSNVIPNMHKVLQIWNPFLRTWKKELYQTGDVWQRKYKVVLNTGVNTS